MQFAEDRAQNKWNQMRFGRKRCMTTMASLRSICLNDLYRHKDLWEFAVEGDIHGVVPVLQMSVPWMPNGRKRSRGKWGDAALLTSLGKWYQVWEKGFYSLVSSLLRRQPKHFGWFSELSPQSRGWVTQAPSLRRVSQFPRFIYYWLPWKQGQRLLNRRLCWGTHPRCTSALLKSAVIVQWWWINCRWIHICPYNQRPSFLFPPGNNILWLCIHRVIRVGVSFHLPCAHCKCLPCLLLDKLSCWACLKARPSQGILKAICCVPHPCSLVKCQKLQFWCGKTPWKAVVNPPW